MDPKRLSSIEGQVVNRQGQCVADATVMIQTGDQPHHDIALLSDQNGMFAFQDLLPGTYTLAAYGPNQNPGTVSATVTPGRVARVRIVLGT